MADMSAELAGTQDAAINPLDAPTSGGTASALDRQAPAPTIEEIQERAKDDEAYWSARNERMVEHQDLFDLVEGTSQDGTILVTLNDPKVYIEKIAGLLGRKEYRIEVPPKGASNSSVAQRIENALRWWRNYASRSWQRGLHNPLPYDQAQSLLLRGWVCTRLMLDPEEEGLIDETLFDPYYIYPRIGRKKVIRVSHIYYATVDELRVDFPDKASLFEGMSPNQRLKLISYYENQAPYWNAIVVNGEWLQEPQQLGYWSWVIAVAKGAFSHSAIGDRQAEDHSKYIGVGFLDALSSMYDLLNKYITIMANAAGKMENPPKLVQTMNGQMKEIDLAPGATSVLAVGENFKVIDVGPNLGSLMPLIQTLQDRMNKAGLPAAMFGEGTNVESGFMGALMMGAAQDTLWTFVSGLAAYHSMRFEKYLTLFRDFSGVNLPVLSPPSSVPAQATPSGQPGFGGGSASPARSIWGEELSPQDIATNGTYVEVVYEDISPQDRIALANLAALLVEKKLVDLRTAREKYLGFDDPDTIGNRVLGDLVYMNQNAVQILTGMSLAQLGRNEDLGALMGQAQQLMAGPNNQATAQTVPTAAAEQPQQGLGRPGALAQAPGIGPAGIRQPGVPPEMMGQRQIPQLNDEQMLANRR